MEEKERYEVISPNLNGYAYIHDFKTDNVLNTYDSCDLLNQQSKRIKELENENKQLKQQLHDLPKKIVEEITNELSNNTSLYFEMRESTSAHCPNKKYEWFNYIRFRNYINAILKKFGAEDGSNND